MSDTKVVMVCGGPRSGTSCVAGVLHYLGIPMGAGPKRKGKANPKGFFEDRELRRIARRSLRNIWDTKMLNRFNDRVDMLRRWYVIRNTGAPVIGGKYPRLSVMIGEMVEALPNLHVIVPDRDPFECARSMKAQWAPRINVDETGRLLAAAFAARDLALERHGVPTLRFSYLEIIKNPECVVADIHQFLRLSATAAQIMAAVNHVDPSLNHYSEK